MVTQAAWDKFKEQCRRMEHWPETEDCNLLEEHQTRINKLDKWARDVIERLTGTRPSYVDVQGWAALAVFEKDGYIDVFLPDDVNDILWAVESALEA